MGYRCKRLRQWVKPLQDPTEYESKRQALQALLCWAEQGQIALYFADESGFCLQPSVPYGWVKQGDQACLLSQHSRRLHVLGLLSTHNHLVAYLSEDSLDSQRLVEAFDEFCHTTAQPLWRQDAKPTVVVLDNAPAHTAALVQARTAYWQEHGLFLFFLPAYAPHLNRVERLWRQLKHRWLKADDYADLTRLRQAVCHVLTHFGSEFTLQFAPIDSNLVFIFNSA